MDARTTMIIAKGKPVSSDAISCVFNNETRKWDITFKSGKTFHYGENNVTMLREPTSLDPKQYQLHRNGRLLENISAIYVFSSKGKEYWHICYGSGLEKDYAKEELEVAESILNRPNAKEVFGYLQETAEFVSVRAEDNTAILSAQYAKINFLGNDTAAAVYLDPSVYSAGTDLDATAPIFPFGCNQSQLQAVTNALANRISVIEGPPGTGKTQTILNIIANLVMQGKTVQVVSNNNSAIENVLEKLEAPQYNMGFMAALLGRSERKQNFLAAQTGEYPDLSDWIGEEVDTTDFNRSLRMQSLKLQEIFKLQNQLALLRQEEQAVRLEQEHHNKITHSAGIFITKKALTSQQLLGLWQELEGLLESEKRIGLFLRLRLWFTYGVRLGKLIKEDSAQLLTELQHRFYTLRLEELGAEMKEIEAQLSDTDANGLLKDFTEKSLQCFRSELACRYGKNKKRTVFHADALWQQPEEFLKEYPLVLCTNYTARSSLSKRAMFDYVIMDEASQTDVSTGLLALSCARNAVIVGDTKQLPNVVTSAQKQQLQAIFERHKVGSEYDFATHSFLDSLCSLMGKRIPRITLCEHYRCNPEIIGFCNQKFYQDELIIMTKGNEQNALRLVTTVQGNHRRDRMNQRQIDVITREILPTLTCKKEEVGIIAPYRNQVKALQGAVHDPEITIDTVHKFQGREKDVIILTTTDDIVTAFSDDPNLLNVAVSRAKKQLILVASEAEQPAGSNVGDLIGYIRYHNGEVQHSAISSVFDYLCDQFTEMRIAYLKRYRRVSEYDSENLMYALICEELQKRQDAALGVICHQPLNLLLRDTGRLNLEEQRFVATGLSHLDFLIYSRISKQPLLAIEVDGYHHHKEGTRQAERDKLKNHILQVYNIPLLRFATNGSGEAERLSSKLDELLNRVSRGSEE